MSDLSLEIIGDFAIVWLLSPKKVFTVAPTGAMARMGSKLPGHALQVSSRAAQSRGSFCSLPASMSTVMLAGSAISAAS